MPSTSCSAPSAPFAQTLASSALKAFAVAIAHAFVVCHSRRESALRDADRIPRARRRIAECNRRDRRDARLRRAQPRLATLRPTLIAGNDPNEAALTYDDGPNDAATECAARSPRRAQRPRHLLRHRPLRAPAPRARPPHPRRGPPRRQPHRDAPLARVAIGARIREELRACNQAIEDALGEPVRYFRPPHGARRPAVLRIARELGLDDRPMERDGHGLAADRRRPHPGHIDRGLARARRRGTGANILLHDGSDRQMGADRSATSASPHSCSNASPQTAPAPSPSTPGVKSDRNVKTQSTQCLTLHTLREHRAHCVRC
jgi:hypothetical protein